MEEKGKLSIHSENIMPIIKKWLYSDSDIFIRELVSNAADAVSKHERLCKLGEAPDDDEIYRIDVRLNTEAKTISVTDNGIGMTAEEIKKYINQIAFSGATEFIEKYKLTENNQNDIIGHFGLGFYSSFMVSETVEIDTKSFIEGEEAAHWVSDGSTDYEITNSDRAKRGTTITLHINEDSKDFLETYRLKAALTKYCGFLPVEIYFSDENEILPEEAPKDDKRNADVDANIIDVEKKEEPINNTSPLWLKKPTDCTDEEYKKFFHEVFFDYNEPLFWIHLNIDYPFRLKGILYFPKLKHELESIEGQVKLFNNQVYIAENIKEVIPDFLLLLKGVIDCPDLPLNVSRSFLQNDGFVTRMSKYITKKVADKLVSIFNDDRTGFNKFWEDINQFIKYGCIRDNDFFDKLSRSLVYKTLNSEFLTADEILERNKGKTDERIFYVSNEQQQSQYIKLLKDEGIEAVYMTTRLDAPFMSYVEANDHSHDEDGTHKHVMFVRVDADISEALKSDKDENNTETNEKLFGLFKDALNQNELKIKTESLKNDSVSAVMLLSEESRRMKEMSSMFGPSFNADMFKDESTLVLNLNNPLIKLISEKADSLDSDIKELACKHIYDLAMLSHKPLEVSEMTAFIERSNRLLERIL